MAHALQALELKGRMLSATRIRVLQPDASAMAADLAMLAAKMPQMLKGMAAVIESDAAIDLALLVKQLRAYGIQPVGVSGPLLAELAPRLGLAVFPPESARRNLDAEPAPAPAASAAAAVAAAPVATSAPPPPPMVVATKPAKIVTTPVRSGQEIYAKDSDLVVIGTVSPGAEVLADGCVHVYGALRGRAHAGANGNREARVFARAYHAELVAIAGTYALTSQLQAAPLGQMAQVLLRDGQLLIEALAL